MLSKSMRSIIAKYECVCSIAQWNKKVKYKKIRFYKEACLIVFRISRHNQNQVNFPLSQQVAY